MDRIPHKHASERAQVIFVYVHTAFWGGKCVEEPRFDDFGLTVGSVSVSASALVPQWWQDTVSGGRPVFQKTDQQWCCAKSAH